MISGNGSFIKDTSSRTEAVLAVKEKKGLEDVYLGETEEAKQVSDRSDEADRLTCFMFQPPSSPEHTYILR